MTEAIPSYRVVFQPIEKPAICAADETLLACARGIGLEIAGPCAGQGTCHGCQIKVLQGEVANGDAGAVWQLACQIRPRSDLVVELSARSLATPERTDVRGFDVAVTPEPVVRGIAVDLPPPTLLDSRPDAQRMADALLALGAKLERVPLPMLAALPETLRRQNWHGTAVLDDNGTLRALLHPDAPLVGLAVDLGTTNVAAYLIDLKSGRRLAGCGLENLQRAYGADIITRLTYAVRNADGRAELARAARRTIRMQIETLCETAGVTPDAIADITVCGNTAMQHLLLGLPSNIWVPPPSLPSARSRCRSRRAISICRRRPAPRSGYSPALAATWAATTSPIFWRPAACSRVAPTSSSTSAPTPKFPWCRAKLSTACRRRRGRHSKAARFRAACVPRKAPSNACMRTAMAALW